MSPVVHGRHVLSGRGETLFLLASSTKVNAGLVRLPYADMLNPAKPQHPASLSRASTPWGEWLRINVSLCPSCTGNCHSQIKPTTPSNIYHGNSSINRRWADTTPASCQSHCSYLTDNNTAAGEELLSLAIQHLCESDWIDWLRVPLIGATSQGDLEMVVLLLNAGLGGWGNRGIGVWMIPGGDGRTLLHSAADSGNGGVINALLDAGAGVVINSVTGSSGGSVGCSRGFSPFHLAAVNGSVPAAIVLARAGAAVHRTAAFQQTALHLAAGTGKVDMVYALVLDLRLAVEAKDDLGSTALHAAASHGKSECVSALLILGAEVDARDGCGRSPLFKACRYGNRGNGVGSSEGCEVIHELLGARADVNARSDDGDTPLHEACRHGNTEAVRLLLRHNADETVRCDLKKTPSDIVMREMLRATRCPSRYAMERCDPSGVANRRIDRDGSSVITADVAEAILAALAAAPACRAWRRRGWLVLLRARSIEYDKKQRPADVVEAAMVMRKEEGTETGLRDDSWGRRGSSLGLCTQGPISSIQLPTPWTAMDMIEEKELLDAFDRVSGNDQSNWVDFGIQLEEAPRAVLAGTDEGLSVPSFQGKATLLTSSDDSRRSLRKRPRRPTTEPVGGLISSGAFVQEGRSDNSQSMVGNGLCAVDIVSANGFTDFPAEGPYSSTQVVHSPATRNVILHIDARTTSASRRVTDYAHEAPHPVDGFVGLVTRILEMADDLFETIVGYI